jgi:hypothetical protein
MGRRPAHCRPMNKPDDQKPRSYVVRVYRRSAEQLAGFVQDVRTGRSRAFSTAAELWRAIGGPRRERDSTSPPQEPRP